MDRNECIDISIDTSMKRQKRIMEGAGQILFSSRLYAWILLTMTAFFCGCNTHFGRDAISQEVMLPQQKSERNIRHFARVVLDNDSLQVTCFRKYHLYSHSIVEERITEKEEVFKPFNSTYYIDNPKFNPLKKWDFLLVKAYDLRFSKTLGSDKWYFYLLPLYGQVFLVIDMTRLCAGGAIDGCVVATSFCYSMIACPAGWLGGRLFGWIGDWHLEENPPGFFRMLSYMPFINLFFPFQTPPYMAEWPGDKKNILAEGNTKVTERTKTTSSVEKQERHLNCPVLVEVFAGKQKLGSGKFFTNQNDGSIQLYKFLQDIIEKKSPSGKKLIMNITLYSQDNKSILLKRSFTLNYEQVMPVEAKKDLVSYNSAETDYLNKVLLRYRSHEYWQQNVLGDDFWRLKMR